MRKASAAAWRRLRAVAFIVLEMTSQQVCEGVRLKERSLVIPGTSTATMHQNCQKHANALAGTSDKWMNHGPQSAFTLNPLDGIASATWHLGWMWNGT